MDVIQERKESNKICSLVMNGRGFLVYLNVSNIKDKLFYR